MGLVRPPFVGRSHELSVLTESLIRATQTGGGVTLIGGEPGIGKTRLVSELAARALADGWQVLRGHADQVEGTTPYLPFVEALRDYVRTCPLDDLKEQLAEGAPEVALLIREVRTRVPDLESSPALRAENERYRLFESTSDFLLNIAQCPRTRGLLLVVDDLHWADKPSLLLLQHLARKVEGAPLVVVGTYRSVELSRAAPLSDTLAELSREHLAERILLRPFSRDDAAALVEGLIGAPAPNAFVEALLQQTEGNPFFIEEVVRDLQADGHDLVTQTIVPPKRDVPESIRQVVGRRLSRLSADANDTLRVAAILGDGLSFGVLEAVLAPGRSDLVVTLEETLAAGLLRDDGERYYFTHALIRQTVLGDLSTPRRARLHRQVAEALERSYGSNIELHLGELAHHFLEASTAGDRDKAVEYARRAGDRAMVSLAYEEAARLYQRAIDVDERRENVPDGELRVRLFLALGDALRKAGEFHQAMEASRQAWRLARERGLPELLARAAIGFEEAMLPTGLSRQGLDDPSVVLQEEALRALGDDQSVVRATLLASLARAVYFAGATERAARLSDEAIAVARRAGDRRVLAYALQSRCFAIWGPEHTPERLEIAADFVRIAEEVGDRELALEGYEWLIRGLFEVGDMPAVDRVIGAYARLADEVRQPRYYFNVANWRAIRAILSGRFVEAEQATQQARTIGEQIRSRNGRVYYVTRMVGLRREQGQMEELAALEPALRELEVQHPLYPSLRALHTVVHAELGQAEEARRVFEHFATTGFGGIESDWLLIPRLVFLSSTCVFLEDADRAPLLYKLLLPYARRYNTEGGCLGVAARFLGLLATTMGKWDTAVAHFEEAIELNARIGADPSVAHTHIAYAAMFLRRRQRDDFRSAREQLEAALLLYRGFEMRYDVTRTEELLATIAGSAEPLHAAYPAGLTTREAEVLKLVAAGRSNREIAEDLVLSVRTVERHITNLYGKIDARGKADATAFALEHGLVSPRRKG